MLSPYRIRINNTNKRTKKVSITNIDNNSHREHEQKQPQLTSNDLKRPQMTSNEPEVKPVKGKNKMRGDANIENIDKFLDEILHNINL